MLVTKDLNKKVFDHIDPWGEILSSIAWEMRDSYHCTIMAIPGQSIFGKDVLFNLASVVDWRVVTAEKQCQVDSNNFR